MHEQQGKQPQGPVARARRSEVRERGGGCGQSTGIQTSESGGAEAAGVGAEGLAGQRGGLLASSAKVRDSAAGSPVQKQEMPARGSSGGPERARGGRAAGEARGLA